jgi:hypothetical protein
MPYVREYRKVIVESGWIPKWRMGPWLLSWLFFRVSKSVAAPFSKKRQSCREERRLDLSRALCSLLIATAGTPFSPGSTPGLAAGALAQRSYGRLE